MARAKFSIICVLILVCSAFVFSSAVAARDRVRISGLQDIQFGSLGTGGDALEARSVCAFSSTNLAGYTITAFGSGLLGAFEMNGSGSTIPIDVFWSDRANQTSGTLLSPNSQSQAFYSDAIHQRCNRGPSSTASLILRIRENAIQSAPAGLYSGTINLIVAPL